MFVTDNSLDAIPNTGNSDSIFPIKHLKMIFYENLFYEIPLHILILKAI